MALNIQGIGQIAVAVHDVARARAFYRDVLGLPFLFDAGPELSFFDCGGVRLMLSRASEPALEPPGSVLYFRIPHLDAAASALRKAGISLEREPHLIARMPDHDLFMAFLRDPEGNLLGLMSEVPRVE